MELLEDVELVSPEIFLVPYAKIQEDQNDGQNVQGFFEQGIVGSLTSLAGVELKEMYSDKTIQHHESCTDKTDECM